MRTSNPALNEKLFRNLSNASGKVMTYQGTINKTFLLFLIVMAGALWTTAIFLSTGATEQSMGLVFPWMIGGVLGGFVVALIIIFKKTWAPVLAPAYGILEGFFVGGLSCYFEMMYPGIVIPAVSLTFGILFMMLVLYKTRLIKPTKKFIIAITACTGAICLVYIVSMILPFFGLQIPGIFGSGPIGIGFSLFVVGIAAFNFILDFKMIEDGAEYGAPKYMEWYCAFGLMVTLIWLYIELLRLLAKLRSR